MNKSLAMEFFTGYQEIGLKDEDGPWWEHLPGIIVCISVGSSSCGSGGSAQAEKLMN